MRNGSRSTGEPPAKDTLHVLNGMGVTLGDSIIGINALAWLKSQHPALRIHLYRSPHAPPYMERLYQLAQRIDLIEPVRYLPLPLASLPEQLVDLSDFMHWPMFDSLAMVDIAAGFDVPTLAVFVSIDPALRVRDYRQCRAMDERCATTDGIHASDDPAVLHDVDRRWRDLVTRPVLPWPRRVGRLAETGEWLGIAAA